MISDEALAAALALIPATFAVEIRSLAPEELPAKLEQALGLGRNSWPVSAIRKLADAMIELGGGPQAQRGARAPMAELVRILPAAGLRISGRRLSHRAGAAGLRERAAIRESGAERNRVVDFLGPRGGRAEQESADRYFSAACRRRCCRERRRSRARESESAARDVARGGESGVSADPNQNAVGR